MQTHVNNAKLLWINSVVYSSINTQDIHFYF